MWVDDDAIRLAVVERLPWIKRNQAQLRTAERQTERLMETGESHYVWGKRYRLQAPGIGKPSICLAGEHLRISAPENATGAEKLAILNRWYRAELKSAVSALLPVWVERLQVPTPTISIRRMKTKWGSAHTYKSAILLNIELAKKHPSCLEYILVHELIHFIEPTHNEHFIALLDYHIPNWVQRKEILDEAPLSDEHWCRLA